LVVVVVVVVVVFLFININIMNNFFLPFMFMLVVDDDVHFIYTYML